MFRLSSRLNMYLKFLDPFKKLLPYAVYYFPILCRYSRENDRNQLEFHIGNSSTRDRSIHNLLIQQHFPLEITKLES